MACMGRLIQILGRSKFPIWSRLVTHYFRYFASLLSLTSIAE